MHAPSPLHPLPIQTAALRLRWLRADDAERMMELNAEPSTRRWLPSHVYPSLAEARTRLRHLVDCCTSPGDPRAAPYVLGVEHRASGALLGHVGFSPFDGEVEVSYAIAEAHRGHGLGAEALLHACQWGAASFQLGSLIAITEADNAPSRRTLERAAFVHEADLVMRFQGRPETVSRYRWTAARPGADRG